MRKVRKSDAKRKKKRGHDAVPVLQRLPGKLHKKANKSVHLTRTERLALLIIKSAPGISVFDLRKELELDCVSPQIYIISNNLIRAGLVRADRNPLNRRQKNLFPIEDGTDKL